MKKIILFLAFAGLILIAVFSCKKNTPSNPSSNTPTCTKTATTTPQGTRTITPTITLTSTVAVVFDDFTDGNNLTDLAQFGGYWYTYDDLADTTDNITCGDSRVYPMSFNAGVRYYGITPPTPVPTFAMSNYTFTSETKPSGVTANYYIRVSGTVDRSGYPYGYAGFGANFLEVAGDGFKNTINATALGFTRLQFWYKNGPSLGAAAMVPWKVKLATSYTLGAGCSMDDNDDMPVCLFTSMNTWQHFDVSLTSGFANEGWGTTACGARAPLSVCVPGAISYLVNGTGAEYKCSASQALAVLNSIKWQTNFGGTQLMNPFDLEIAEVVFIK